MLKLPVKTSFWLTLVKKCFKTKKYIQMVTQPLFEDFRWKRDRLVRFLSDRGLIAGFVNFRRTYSTVTTVSFRVIPIYQISVDRFDWTHDSNANMSFVFSLILVLKPLILGLNLNQKMLKSLVKTPILVNHKMPIEEVHRKMRRGTRLSSRFWTQGVAHEGSLGKSDSKRGKGDPYKWMRASSSSSCFQCILASGKVGYCFSWLA